MINKQEIYSYVRSPEFPQCDGFLDPEKHLNHRCKAKAPYHLNGENYCKRHANQAAFELVFEHKAAKAQLERQGDE